MNSDNWSVVFRLPLFALWLTLWLTERSSSKLRAKVEKMLFGEA